MKDKFSSFIKFRVFFSNLSTLSLALVIQTGIFNAGVAHAHSGQLDEHGSLPSCVSVAADPDGDGYGWALHFTGAHSCIVDEDTHPKPLYARVGENLRPLDMIRTYWDPNVDFANKEIECTNYRTEPLAEWQPKETFSIKHYPLPNLQPWISEYELTYTQFDEEQTGYNTWRATHGTYFGSDYYYNPDDYIGFFASQWGEPIEIDGLQGMRFWRESAPIQGETDIINGYLYQECKYTSGLPFRPTGHWDSQPTLSDVVVPDIPPLLPGPSADEKPEIINRTTGQYVELQSFSWNITEDLLYKRIWCDDRSWNVGIYDSFYTEPDSYIFMPPLSGNGTGNLYFNHRGHNWRIKKEWSVENGNLTIENSNFPVGGGWYELHTRDSGSQAIRVWYSEDRYDECWTSQRSGQALDVIPTGAVTETTTLKDEQLSGGENSSVIPIDEAQILDAGGGAFDFLLFLLTLPIVCVRRLSSVLTVHPEM